MKSKQLLSVKISLGTYQSFIDQLIGLTRIDRFSYVCVANVHMLIEAHKDNSFASVVTNADIVTPDGKPITWALRWLYGIRQKRVAGMDLLPDLLSASEKQGVPVGFYGGTEDMLVKTKAHIKNTYPELDVVAMYSPPFRPLRTDEERIVVEMFTKSNARLIFVVLGCPKQEKWMNSMRNKMNGVFVGIGGALPVLVGMQKRAPFWMHDMGLEWLYRLGQEPKRLYKRYITTNTLFIYLITKEKLSFKKSKNNASL